jgi:hypothetical protein
MKDARQALLERQLEAAVRAAIARASDEKLERKEHESLAKRMSCSLETSQVRGLENVAFTTDKISDITDLIKRSVGRARKREGWAKDDVGSELIAALKAVRSVAERIVEELPDFLGPVKDSDLPRRVHLELCRELVKHLASDYLFLKQPKAPSNE